MAHRELVDYNPFNFFLVGVMFQIPLERKPQTPLCYEANLDLFIAAKGFCLFRAWVFWGESFLLGVFATVGEVKAASSHKKQRLLYVLHQYANIFHIYLTKKQATTNRWQFPKFKTSELKPWKNGGKGRRATALWPPSDSGSSWPREQTAIPNRWLPKIFPAKTNHRNLEKWHFWKYDCSDSCLGSMCSCLPKRIQQLPNCCQHLVAAKSPSLHKDLFKKHAYHTLH